MKKAATTDRDGLIEHLLRRVEELEAERAALRKGNKSVPQGRASTEVQLNKLRKARAMKAARMEKLVAAVNEKSATAEDSAEFDALFDEIETLDNDVRNAITEVKRVDRLEAREIVLLDSLGRKRVEISGGANDKCNAQGPLFYFYNAAGNLIMCLESTDCGRENGLPELTDTNLMFFDDNENVIVALSSLNGGAGTRGRFTINAADGKAIVDL